MHWNVGVRARLFPIVRRCVGGACLGHGVRVEVEDDVALLATAVKTVLDKFEDPGSRTHTRPHTRQGRFTCFLMDSGASSRTVG